MRKLLIVVDYQKDFVDGSLGFVGAEALDAVIAAKVREYRADGAEVVATLDTHDDNYAKTQEGQKLPVAHCLRGSDGWRIYGATAEALSGCRTFEKPAFGSAELFDYLREGDFSHVELCGLVSNICVLSNAVLAKAALPEAKVIVDAAATAAADADMNEKALDVLAGVQVEVINR